ncbi:MAG: energy transducer TonB [Acidobacteriaceae bacterium]|nr:energy transducer TonB [Acidobacteriaceae bacterium]
MAKFAPRVLRFHELYAPVAIPNKLGTPNEVAPAPDIGLGTAVSDANATPFAGVIGSVPGPPPPVEPTAAKKEQATHGPIRIGTISEANLLRKVMPVYPPLAKSARVQGTVEFTALISKDGNIENLKLVYGHPLLVNAAKEAVEQWKYRPTLLNGVPVEVVTDIFVNFTLNQ